MTSKNRFDTQERVFGVRLSDGEYVEIAENDLDILRDERDPDCILLRPQNHNLLALTAGDCVLLWMAGIRADDVPLEQQWHCEFVSELTEP